MTMTVATSDNDITTKILGKASRVVYHELVKL